MLAPWLTIINTSLGLQWSSANGGLLGSGMGSSENSGKTQNFVILNCFISSMSLQLQLSDNTYPKGREGWTHWYSIVMHLDKQNQRALGAFSNSRPRRLLFP